MPSAERYAREKAKLAEKGTTPYKHRVVKARRRTAGITQRQAAGHPGKAQRSITATRARREEIRQFEGQPGVRCQVCGCPIEPGRPNSYLDRVCDGEVVRRYRAGGQPSFRGAGALAADAAWVAERRASCR